LTLFQKRWSRLALGEDSSSITNHRNALLNLMIGKPISRRKAKCEWKRENCVCFPNLRGG